MEKRELPDGWRWQHVKRLVREVESGFSWPKSRAVTAGVPHLRTNNIAVSGELDLSALVCIPAESANLERYGLQAGDVLFNNTNSVELVGKTALVRADLPYSFSNHITRLRADPERVEAAWLALGLRRLWQTGYFAAICRKWIGQAGFSPTRLKEVCIAVPPVEDQRRIIARFDVLAERIEEAKGLRRAARQEADALLPAATARVFEGGRWTRLTVQQLLDGARLLNGRSFKSTNQPSDVRCLTLSSMRDGRVDCEEAKPVPAKMDEVSPYLVQQGDVFIVRGSGSKDLVGRAGLVEQVAHGVIFPDLLIRVPLDATKILPAFLVEAWNSKPMRDVIEQAAKTTSGIWKINQQHIKSLSVPVPSVPEQRRLMGYLAGIRARSTELRRLQAETHAELDALLPSVLDRAFRGEL